MLTKRWNCTQPSRTGGERASANQFGEIIAQRFANNPNVQIYLGGYYEETGNLTLSNQRFHQAYAADKTSSAACQVSALALLREGKTDQALARLEQAEKIGDPVDPGITFNVAQALHKENKPEAAAALLKKVGATAPDVHRDKNFRKLAQSVEKSTGNRGDLVKPRGLTARPAFWWSLAAAAVLAGIAWRDIHLAGHQRLCVVNGLPTPITIQIDGGEGLEVVAGSVRKRLTLSGGEHTVKVTSPAELAGESTFAIESSRISRWFKSPVHVLDPTRSSVVFWEETIFSEHEVDDELGFEIATGKLLHSYDDADYLFRTFPRKLEVSNKTRQVKKTRVDRAQVTPIELIISDPSVMQDPATLDYLEPHLLFGEDRKRMLGIYVSMGTNLNVMERCYKFLQAHIERQPIDVEWHRTFQGVASLQGDKGLTSRYDALLKTSPRDASLLYLRGRLEHYHQDSAPYFRQALQAEPDHALTLSATGFSETARGEFQAALRSVQRALEADEEISSAKELREILLIALGRYQDFETECRRDLQESPTNFGAVMSLITSQAYRGEAALARQTWEAFATALREGWPADPHELVKRSEEKLLRNLGDFQGATRVAESMTEPLRRDATVLVCSLLSGETDQAEKLIASLPKPQQGEMLLWCCLTHAAAEDGQVAKCRERAAASLAEDGGVNAEIARLLSLKAATADQVARAVDLDIEADKKAAVLLLVADNAGDKRAELIELAERLSQLPSAYRPLLESALARGGA